MSFCQTLLTKFALIAEAFQLNKLKNSSDIFDLLCNKVDDFCYFFKLYVRMKKN